MDFETRRLTVLGRHVRLDEHGVYSLGHQLTVVRVPPDEDLVRTVAQVPPDELDLAVSRVVQDAVSIDEAGLMIAVRRLFGWRRAGADIQAAVGASVARGLRDGWLRRTHRGSLRSPGPE